MLLPGELSAQTNLPVCLSKAMKLGAFGAGTSVFARFEPFDVFTSSRSPTAVTEQALMLFGLTPNSLIMLKSQTISTSWESPLAPSVAQAQDLAAVRDNPEPIALDQRRAADALLGIVEEPVSDLFAGKLPLEPAVALAETEQAAQIDFRRVSLEPAGAVVGGAEDAAAGHHRRAVSSSSRAGQPSECSWPSRPASGPSVASNFPTFHSTGRFLPSGVLFRSRRAAPLRPVRAGSNVTISDNNSERMAFRHERLSGAIKVGSRCRMGRSEAVTLGISAGTVKSISDTPMSRPAFWSAAIHRHFREQFELPHNPDMRKKRRVAHCKAPMPRIRHLSRRTPLVSRPAFWSAAIHRRFPGTGTAEPRLRAMNLLRLPMRFQSTFSTPKNGILLSMNKEFHQTVWDDRLADAWAAILRLALDEDLGVRRLHHDGLGGRRRSGPGRRRGPPAGSRGGIARRREDFGFG